MDSRNLNIVQRWLWRGGLLLATLFLAVSCIKDEKFTHENTTLVNVGSLAPDFEVELLDGGKRRLSDMRGKVVMLIFFSAECPDCHAQFAEIERLVAESEPSFEVLAISRGDSPALVKEFQQEYNIAFPLGIDPHKTIYSLYATRYVPRCFLIGRDFKVKGLTVEFDAEKLNALWRKAEAEAE